MNEKADGSREWAEEEGRSKRWKDDWSWENWKESDASAGEHWSQSWFPVESREEWMESRVYCKAILIPVPHCDSAEKRALC